MTDFDDYDVVHSADLAKAKLDESARERKREMWMWFVGLMLCVLAITVAALGLLQFWQARNEVENVTKRAKLEACQGIETEAARVVCVNGWGSP